MAFRRIITRTGNSPISTLPTAIKTEFDRLVSIGTVTRTEVFVTNPADLAEQNIGPNEFKSTITEIWLNQTECNNFKQWTADNHSSVFEAWKTTNNIADTLISSGEI